MSDPKRLVHFHRIESIRIMKGKLTNKNGVMDKKVEAIDKVAFLSKNLTLERIFTQLFTSASIVLTVFL